MKNTIKRSMILLWTGNIKNRKCKFSFKRFLNSLNILITVTVSLALNISLPPPLPSPASTKFCNSSGIYTVYLLLLHQDSSEFAPCKRKSSLIERVDNLNSAKKQKQKKKKQNKTKLKRKEKKNESTPFDQVNNWLLFFGHLNFPHRCSKTHFPFSLVYNWRM